MKRILLILILSFAVGYLSFACRPYDRANTADEYYTFRICGENMEGYDLRLAPFDTAKQQMENCQSWADITSQAIPLEDIQQVIYNWSYEELENLHLLAIGKKAYSGSNAFACYLINHHDIEVISFLLLAKKCELTREKQDTEWYYPVNGDEEGCVLTEIVEKAKQYKETRLLDRYTLQIMRALIANRQYNECLNLWLERKAVFRKNPIKKMAEGYAAGAYYHVGEIEKAMTMFIKSEDISSYLFCLRTEGIKYNKLYILLSLYNSNPNNENIFPILQNIMHTIERRERRDYSYHSIEFKTLNAFVLRVLNERKSRNLSAWYYTASYISDKLGNTSQALNYIQIARSMKSEQDLNDAIRVFHLYLRAKNIKRYDSDFENYLYKELVWLDNKIVSNLDSAEFLIPMWQRDGVNQYYWNDIMRKIVISQVVPKCIASKYKVRALQFLNYADNSIWKIIECPEEDKRRTMIIYNQKPICYNKNYYDYRTDFFINLDSIGVKYIKRLAYRMKEPLCSLDSFLYKRCYNDMNYLNEIIGTQLIAEMKFKEAVQYLTLVPDSFIKTRNVYSELEYDAFSINAIRNQPGKSYKLDFAKKMYDLEKKIKSAKNPNDKAEFMLTYARGLENSIKHCWKLTSYYRGAWSFYPFYSKYQTYLYGNIAGHSNKIKEKAFQLFTNAERAANALYEWNRYETIVIKYPKTKMAQFIRGHCDELADYKRVRE